MVRRDHFLSTQWMALLGHEAHCLLTAVVFMAPKHRRRNSKKDLFTLFSALCVLGRKKQVDVLLWCPAVSVRCEMSYGCCGCKYVSITFTENYWITSPRCFPVIYFTLYSYLNKYNATDMTMKSATQKSLNEVRKSFL